MRLAFLLLILANLIFFAWAQGHLGGQEEGREPQRLKELLYPERIEVTVQAALPPQACRRIEGLAAAEAERLRQALEAGGLRASVETREEVPSFWVNISALPNQAAADKKAGELRSLGVADFHVVQENGSFAVSLGLFRDESEAKDMLLQLGRKGVKSARIDVKTTPPALASVEARGAAETLAKRLPELLAGMAGAAATDCP